MQTTVAAWVMATLTPSEFMVALVQTASTAPALLFGLVAGALADIVDRRRLILATQWLLLASTAILGAATLAGLVGPAMLLALTFMVGAGLSLYLPAQAASIHDLVSREDLPRAVALGAVAFNVARAVGPALAGGIAAWLGSGSALVASSLFFVLMIVAAHRMKKRERGLPGVPETVFSGVLSGLRFARHSLAMRSLMIRNVSFSLCASAFWALLPVIARDQLRLGAGGFGLLSAGFGIGAIVGALAIPGQLQRRSLNAVVTWAIDSVDRRDRPVGRHRFRRHRDRGGLRRRRGVGFRACRSFGRNTEQRARLGSSAGRLRESGRNAGESRARQCAVGRGGLGGWNSTRAGRLRRHHALAARHQSPRTGCDGQRGRRHAGSAVAGTGHCRRAPAG